MILFLKIQDLSYVKYYSIKMLLKLWSYPLKSLIRLLQNTLSVIIGSIQFYSDISIICAYNNYLNVSKYLIIL